jgi:UDPglucose 6-dehydrogenase
MAELLIIGAGIVGRATGRGFAQRGHAVAFADVDDRVIGALRAEGARATTIGEIDWRPVDVVFVCVPTRAAAGRSAFDSLLDTIDVIGAGLRRGQRRIAVAVRSTLMPGMTDQVIVPRLEAASAGRAGVDWGIVVNPEFLRTASSDGDFERPWLTVIGAADGRSGDMLDALYEPFGSTVIRCTPTEAELIKIGSNCFNALKISYFNELHALSQTLGADGGRVTAAIAAGAEGIWNPTYGTRGGTPFAGACLPQDLENMASAIHAHGWEQLLIQATVEVNGRVSERAGSPA